MVFRALSKSRLLLAITAVALLSPLPAFSQIYVGAYGGPVFPEDAGVTITDRFRLAVFTEVEDEGSVLSDINIPITDFDFDTRVMAGGRVGYWLEDFNLPFLGVQAEVFGGSPNIKDQTVTMGFDQTIDGVSTSDRAVFDIKEVDLNIVTVGLNLMARWPQGPIQPYGGVGLGLVYAHIDEVGVPSQVTIISSDGTRQTLTGGEFVSQFNVGGDDAQNLFVRDNDFVPALLLTGGVRAFVLENVALFAEYKFMTTEFEFRDLEMDYDASHIFGGIEFYFGPGSKKKP